MKYLLSVLILFYLTFELQATIISDFDGHISEQDLKRLELRCDELQKTHNLNFYIYFFSDVNDKPNLSQVRRGSTRFVHVFINRADTSVAVNTVNIDNLRSRFFENVFFQFVSVPMKEGLEIVPSIFNTLNVIEKEFERLKIEETRRREVERKKDELDPRAVQLIWIAIIVFIGFILLFIVKGAKNGNRYEVLEFYGLSRLPLWLTLIIGTIGLIGGSFLILQSIGNGAWIVVMCYLFIFYPVMVVLGWVIKGAHDSFELNHHASKKPQLTLGQQLWLVRPSSTTEHLMEVNFYEQIIKKRIHLEIYKEEVTRREVSEYYISPGSAFDSQSDFTRDEYAFINELYQEPERLKPFLHRVYKSFGRFKAYRKDYLLKELYRSGLLIKYGWPINVFALSSKGLEIQEKLRNEEQNQARLIAIGIDQPSKIKSILPRLTPAVLFIPHFERQLTHFYNEVVEMDLLKEAMSLPIGFLFHPDFSMRAFNVMLMGAYQYRIPWEDFIDEDYDPGF